MPVEECTADDGTGLGHRGGPVLDALHGACAADEGVFRVDINTGRIWLSRELYRILGVDRVGFVPTLESLSGLLDPLTAARIGALPASLGDATRARGGRGWVTHPDGHRRLVELRVWADLRGLFGTCRDVTEGPSDERARRALDDRQESILRAVRDGICGLDRDGRILFVNGAMRRLLLRDEEELAGRRLHDLVHRAGEDEELHPFAECPYSARMQLGSAVDAAFHRGDGTRIEVGLDRSRPRVDDDGCTIVSFRDITARRAAARLLQTSLRQVQALSAQRGALLVHLAEAEERERLRLAADIHDDTIQALDAIALRLSNRGERAGTDAERDAFADAEIEVREVSERLRRLMFELMPPDTTHDLRAALRTYCGVLFARSLMSYELVGDVTGVPADRSLIAYRLLQEVVRNAVKHSHGARVRIDLRCSSAELVARVSDDGVGMNERSGAPTHAGLRIVRRRVEAAGGSTRVSGGLDGRGTSIEIRLPCAASATR